MTTAAAKPFIALAYPTRLRAYTLSDGDAPSAWIQVAVVGDYESSAYGKFSITRADLAQMLSNFTSGKYPEPPTEIALDYDHLSMAPKAPGDGKAGGWFKQLELRADGDELWARIEFTVAGADAVKQGEYRFVSPTFTKDFTTNTGEAIGCTLLCAAMTNRPFLQGMAPMSLADRRAGYALAVLGDSDKRTRVDDAICRAFNEPFSDPWNCYLVEIFENVAVFYRDGRYYSVTFTIADDGTVSFEGMPVEVVVQYAPLGAGASLMATQKNSIVLRAGDKDQTFVLADVLAALPAEALEQLPLVKELRAKVPAEGSVVVNAAEFTALKGDVKTLSESLASETKKREATELQLNTDRANAKVDALIKAGKLTPAQKEWAQKYALSTPADFDAFAGTLSVVLKLDRSTGTGQGGDASDPEAQLEAKTKDIMLAEKVSYAKAYDLAMQRNPELYEAYTRSRESVSAAR